MGKNKKNGLVSIAASKRKFQSSRFLPIRERNTTDLTIRTDHTKRDLVFSDPASHIKVMGLSSQIKLTRNVVVLTG